MPETHEPYDAEYEQALRAELQDLPPHVNNMTQLRDEDGELIPGCYVTNPAGVD